MNKVIRALMATGAEMHWHYDESKSRYVVRLFCGQRSKKIVIDQDNVTTGTGQLTMEKDLVQQIYRLKED